MHLYEHIAAATESTTAVVRGVRPGQLDLPTPCAEWPVRRLANHLVHWAATVSELAARKEPAPADLSEETDHTRGDWVELFADRAGGAAQAWARPGALTGTTDIGGSPLPAELAATLMLGELVVHGWDLAVATGQPYAYPPQAAAAVLPMLTTMGAQGREMGIFAAEVPLPPAAPVLDRVLALSGRDPAWTRQLTSSAHTRQSSSTP